MNPADRVLEKLITANYEYESALDRLASEFRRTVLIPLCKKYEMTFCREGNDVYLKTHDGYRFYDWNDLKKYKEMPKTQRKDIKAALDVLCTETAGGDCFGSLVFEVQVDDLTE